MKDDRMRVLFMTSGFQKDSSGGIAAFLFNFYREMDHRVIDADFVAIAYQCFDLYRAPIESLGGQLHCLNVHQFKGLRGKRNYLKAFSQFLSAHEYDIIHINSGGFFTNFLLTRAAKKWGNKAKVISHSHSMMTTYRGMKKASILAARRLFPRYADYFLACSVDAGAYMYPPSVVKGPCFSVINNAIRADDYAFQPQLRATMRRELNVEDKLVVGHVGRFTLAKNHGFILDVFNALLSMEPTAHLLLVGEGNTRQKIMEAVDAMGLRDHVSFTGLRDDVPALMQAMDVFLFPSLFEGLGVVAIEAQASGLPVIASSVIPEEAAITDLFIPISLDERVADWAKAVVDAVAWHRERRRDRSEDVASAGFDVRHEAEKLMMLYETLLVRGPGCQP